MINTPSRLRSVINPDGAVILDIKQGVMLRLNSVGGYIWERLRQGICVEDIVREIVRETSAEPAEVTRDVHEFLEQLESRQLITIAVPGQNRGFCGPK